MYLANTSKFLELCVKESCKEICIEELCALKLYTKKSPLLQSSVVNKIGP